MKNTLSTYTVNLNSSIEEEKESKTSIVNLLAAIQPRLPVQVFLPFLSNQSENGIYLTKAQYNRLLKEMPFILNTGLEKNGLLKGLYLNLEDECIFGSVCKDLPDIFMDLPAKLEKLQEWLKNHDAMINKKAIKIEITHTPREATVPAESTIGNALPTFKYDSKSISTEEREKLSKDFNGVFEYFDVRQRVAAQKSFARNCPPLTVDEAWKILILVDTKLGGIEQAIHLRSENKIWFQMRTVGGGLLRTELQYGNHSQIRDGTPFALDLDDGFYNAKDPEKPVPAHLALEFAAWKNRNRQGVICHPEREDEKYADRLHHETDDEKKVTIEFLRSILEKRAEDARKRSENKSTESHEENEEVQNERPLKRPRTT